MFLRDTKIHILGTGPAPNCVPESRVMGERLGLSARGPVIFTQLRFRLANPVWVGCSRCEWPENNIIIELRAASETPQSNVENRLGKTPHGQRSSSSAQ